MIKILKHAAIAAAALATLNSTAALAQANLTFHTAGSGTPVALTATALVEYAERGIANIQVSEGKVATNYLKDLATGQDRPCQRAFHSALPMSKGAGPYAKMGKETGAELSKNIQLLYPLRWLFTYVCLQRQGHVGLG